MRKVKFSMVFVLVATSLILTTYGDVFAEMKLRYKSKKLDEKDIESVVKKFNFFDKKLNQGGGSPNDFVDNGDGTVTDRATGLMWEQKGSEKLKVWFMAKKYVKKLNKKKFAGHKDWRIPTIEELYSLLQPNTKQLLYIHPVFATEPSHCWSIDTSKLIPMASLPYSRKLTLDYMKGTFSDAWTQEHTAGATATNFYSFVRAVRSKN